MNENLVYIRSCSSKRDVFSQITDYELFFSMLKKCSLRFDIVIHSFCLMPTNYHLLVEGERKILSRCIRYLHQRFACRFELVLSKQKLFEMINKMVVEKNYFAGELSLLIHSIPYKTGITNDPFCYEWSSLAGYIYPLRRVNWIDYSMIYEQICSSFFYAHKEYKKIFNHFCAMDLPYHLYDSSDASCLGSKVFCDAIKQI